MVVRNLNPWTSPLPAFHQLIHFVVQGHALHQICGTQFDGMICIVTGRLMFLRETLAREKEKEKEEEEDRLPR